MALRPQRLKLWSICTLTLIVSVSALELAGAAAETDARFEKLAKELYPEAKQEGALVVYTIWDVDHVRSILAAFSKSFPGISAMFRLLIAGEYALTMPSLLHDVLEERGKGSPVDFVKSAPPVISPQQLGIYGKAPHPTAAKLFAEWMITPEGQLAVAAVGREVSRKGVKSKASVESAWGGKVKPIPIVNRAFSENPRKWLDENVKPLWEN